VVVPPRFGNPLRTLRGRLVTTYACVALLAVVLSALFSINALQRGIEERMREDLVDDAKLAADAVTGPMAEQNPTAVRAYLSLVDRDVRARVQVVDREARPIAATLQAPATGGPDDPGISAAFAGATVVTEGNPSAAVADAIEVTVPIRSPDGLTIGALRASTSLQDVRGTSVSLTTTALLGALAASALAAVVGLLLATSVAQPVQRVSQAAVDLARGRPTEPLPEPRGGTEEVSTLVNTFNSLSTQLRQEQAARREFAFDVSHELHSLTSAMQTATAALRASVARGDEAAAERLVAGLGGHTRRLSRLADDLLELARWEGGRLTIDPVEMDLGELVGSLVDEWSPEAGRRETTLERRLPAGELPMRGDPIRLAQALGNLLENALKYTGAGGRVEVEVTTEQAGRGRFYRVAVADSGPGVPPELLPHIFERHVRAQTRGGGAADGMGLGLPIAREIVLAHGGDLTAESSPGQGARFTVRLPA
jgi:signal transduction histidine kinase